MPRKEGKMPEIREGETHTGDELIELLGGEDKVNDRLSALGNDEVRLILADEGNDNYKVLHVVKVN